MNMKRFKLTAITGAVLVLLAVLASCASMIVVSVDTDAGVTGPSQTRQYRNINASEVKLYGFYKDGKRRQFSATPNDITFDSSKAGPQTVTVKYLGSTLTFETTVMALTGITVVSHPKTWKRGVQPTRRTTALEESLLKKSFIYEWPPELEIQASWDQMGSEKLNSLAIQTECEYEGFRPSVVGVQTVTVKWRGKQTTFNVEVVE
jgi:hypothetical protein